jgi:hypothetical protein
MAIPSRRRLAKYFAELQRIEEHRSAYMERRIQRIYKEMLTDLQQFLGVEYATYAVDDALTYATLAQKGEYARFLEQVQAKVNKLVPSVNEEITETVKEMYRTAYEGMVNAVYVSTNDYELSKLLGGIKLTQPQVIKAAVTNPIAKLTLSKTLEKNRKQIVHNIKQTVTVGIMNGDRMSTMAGKIKNDVDQNYRKAMLIARTEVHRVVETGHNNASEAIAKTFTEAESAYRITKQWYTMQDSSVRHTSKADHRKMHGKVVLQEEEFDLGHGVTAPCPGQSGKAYHDCNCRCKIIRDLMSDEEFFDATGRHFPEYEKKKKPKQTKKKLESDIASAKAEQQEIFDKYGVKNLEELQQKKNTEFLDVPKAEFLETSINDMQEKINKKVEAAQKKALKKQEETVKKQIDDFEIKTYSGIWKDDVTTKDWSSKKDAIPKKKEYFEGKLQYADGSEAEKWQKLLDDLEDFNLNGAAYNELEQQLRKITSDLTNLQKNGKIKKVVSDAFSQERKDAALWAKSTKEADKELRSVSGEVWRNASKSEREAIYDYTKGSGKFNRPLSGYEKPWSKSGSGWEPEFKKGVGNVWIDFEGAGDEIRRTTDIISRSTYDRDIWLQRGCKGDALESFLDLPYGTFEHMTHSELQQFVGRDNRIYSFVSTAVSKGKGFDGTVIMNIYAPRGTQMMYCEPFSRFGSGDGINWDGLSEQSSFGYESEMLLQRGASYTITKIEKTNGMIYIDMEVHPEDGYDWIQQDPSEWKGSTKNYHD